MKGDILITAVGTIGNSYLVQNEEFLFQRRKHYLAQEFLHTD